MISGAYIVVFVLIVSISLCTYINQRESFSVNDTEYVMYKGKRAMDNDPCPPLKVKDCQRFNGNKMSCLLSAAHDGRFCQWKSDKQMCKTTGEKCKTHKNKIIDKIYRIELLQKMIPNLKEEIQSESQVMKQMEQKIQSETRVMKRKIANLRKLEWYIKIQKKQILQEHARKREEEAKRAADEKATAEAEAALGAKLPRPPTVSPNAPVPLPERIRAPRPPTVSPKPPSPRNRNLSKSVLESLPSNIRRCVLDAGKGDRGQSRLDWCRRNANS